MAEILENFSLVFRSKRWHHKDISKLTDLYVDQLSIENKIFKDIPFMILFQTFFSPFLSTFSWTQIAK